MKILGIIFAVLFILTFIFGQVSINGKSDFSLIGKVGACLLGSAIATLVFGLPILGIIYLFQ